MAETDPIIRFEGPREVEIPERKDPGVQAPGAPSFQDMFSSFLKDVNSMQMKADDSIQKMVTGEIKDVHQVMLAVGEAKVAFNLLLEIRNKTMEAYQEVIKMRG